jgi:hypothetical protein
MDGMSLTDTRLKGLWPPGPQPQGGAPDKTKRLSPNGRKAAHDTACDAMITVPENRGWQPS